MADVTDDCPLDVSDVEAIAAFREVLAKAEYSSSGVKAAIKSGPDNVPLWPTNLPLALRRLRAGGTLATLIKLFLLGVPVSFEEFSVAVAPLSIDTMTGLGLVEMDAGEVKAKVRFAPSGGLLLACDRQAAPHPRRDQVMGVSPSSVLLANLTVRDPVETALDLGTGGGVQALLAARHARHVVATDVSERAVNFARFNCLLNAIDNVECRTGDFMHAVAGATFDLILCNPPFVISPDHDVLFRDGGRPGDSLSRELVETIPGHLNPGGLAQILVSWACRGGEGWSEPLQRWVEGSGCDARLICVEKQPALQHAASWNEHLAPDPERQSEAFNRWADYLEAEDIDAIGTGAVILRRRTGRNWIRMDTATGFRGPRSGTQIARLMQAEDRAARLSDADLLEQRLRPGRHHHFEQTLAAGSLGDAPTEMTVVLDGGLPIRRTLDADAAGVLLRLDGSRPVGDAITDSERATGSSQKQALDVLREMVRLDVLRPGDGGSGQTEGRR